jgi:acetyltransferase-like isoleucine patch superfamily enzyme
MNCISPTARLYGDVALGKNVIVEDYVILGHPLAREVNALMQGGAEIQFDKLYALAARGRVVVGDNSIIRAHSVIYTDVEIGSGFEGGHHILIREGTRVGRAVYLKAFTELMKNVSVGNECRIAGLIADNAVLEDHVSVFGHVTHQYRTYVSRETAAERSQPLRAAHICEGAIVGRGATVVGDVRIGRCATIAAGTTVWFDVEDGSLVHGPRPTTKIT